MNVASLTRQYGQQPQQPLVSLETPSHSSFASQHSALGARHSVLVGRETELTQLQSVFEKVLQGKRQVVFVTGEAGIGKTTLVDAFLARLSNHADVCITLGQCVEQYGLGEAYLPLLEATTRFCRAPGGKQHIAALQRHAPSWLAQLPNLLAPQDFERLQHQVQGTNRERMLREMAETAEWFATTQTMVLVLEDLHWSDVSTLDWMTYMARRRGPARLLILGTYRPADVQVSTHPLRGVVQDLAARGQCEELQVTPLKEEAIRGYLRSRFGELSLPAAVTSTLARRSGGNPLFIVNMVNDLVRQGAVTQTGGQWVAQPEKVTEIAERVPDTIRQLIERQVERLSEGEQRLLEVASVAGVEFTSMDVAAGFPTTEKEVEESCERFARAGQWLRTAGFTEWSDGAISGRYSFLHAMYHEVIYARVTEARRVQLHRRIAARKEAAYGERAREIAAELAAHFVKGRDYHKALRHLQQAGKNAVQRSAHQEAVAHFTRGLDLVATLPDTPERRQYELALQAALGVPLLRTKGYAAPEVARAYGRARELCQQIGEQPALFTALAGLCSFYLVRAELQTARELAEQCLRLAQHTHDSSLVVEAHFILGVTLFYSGELTSAHAILEQGSALYDPQAHGSLTVIYGQDPGVGCRSYAALASWFLGSPDQALEKSHGALSAAQELSHSFSIGAALHTAAWLRQYRQEGRAVQAHAEEEIILSQKEGFALWLAAGTIQRGWALSWQGDREQGLAQLREGMSALHATGANLAQPYHLALLAQAHGKNGQPREGLEFLDQALAVVDKTGERYYEAEVYRLKGELTLYAGAGDWELETGPSFPQVSREVETEAEEYFLKALAVACRQEARSLELRAAMSLARLWRQQNKGDEARELLEEMYSWFTEGFDTKDLQEAATLLHELGGVTEGQKSKVNSQKSKIKTEERKYGGTGEWENGGMEDDSRLASSILRRAWEEQRRLVTSQTPDPRRSDSTLRDSNLQPLAPSLFRCEGQYWTLSFAGATCRLKDARGLHYIARLLQQPHQEIHAITLITESVEAPSAHAPNLLGDHAKGFSDTEEVLDPQTRTTYKQRLSELGEELAEARQFHDLGRSERLAVEIDELTHKLTQAVGLDGRAQQGGSLAERARVNITRAIKLALRKITEHHPTLGHHLTVTIKTGVHCSYTPDTRMPISWRNQM